MVWAWIRMVMMVAVVLLPGGFPLLLAYVSLRTLRNSWRRAQEEALSDGHQVTLREVVSTLHFKELVREARASL
ncbi:hypothetical protein [Corallococcus macrosporus]|uniref:Uncharacterized protein n=2 Tax=Myxococcaceae TaxID=31 RepID=A0A250JV39_9BACT|nr:hypothetical protein [Corallococcus macrosporus]AEI66434.1 hypothetical protein LILAB_22695 [Corallococcus macrosporus]ATB47332.1 hypothetical protein MYMAC_002940 [Corallococcus macrosporus DSM 14697]